MKLKTVTTLIPFLFVWLWSTGFGACLVSLVGISISTIIQKRTAAGTPLASGSLWQYIGAIAVVSTASYFTEAQAYNPTWQLYAALGWLVVVLGVALVVRE